MDLCALYKIAGASENLVIRYNPNWSGAGETIHQIHIPDCCKESFEFVYHEEFLNKLRRMNLMFYIVLYFIAKEQICEQNLSKISS